MTTIGPNTIGSASRLLDALLKKHAEEIDKAYLKAEKSFKADLSVTFSPADGGGIEMAVGISFVKERCKDSVKGQVNEHQDDLFNQRKPYSEAKPAYPATIEIDDETTVDETTVVDSAVAIEGGRPALNAAGNAWIEIE